MARTHEHACARLCESCSHECKQPAMTVIVSCPRYEMSEAARLERERRRQARAGNREKK